MRGKFEIKINLNHYIFINKKDDFIIVHL